MTNEEAIARIKDHKIVHKMNEPRAIYISEALDLAIKALEKLQKIEDVISAEACWTFDEDGNDNHVMFVEDLEKELKDD